MSFPKSLLDYHFPSEKKNLLFFDSGVGGLSILQAVEATFGDKFNYSYLFDNELFPYSEKSDLLLKNQITPLLVKIVKQQNIDLLVVACNTASTLVLEDLRAILSIPVVGVVPAIKPAVEYLVKHKQEDKAVGVVATKATIARPYTLKLVKDFAGPLDYNVTFIGTTTLVEYAEAKLRGEDYSKYDLKEVFNPWLMNSELNLGVIVLACTHFSLIKEDIQALFPGVFLIDACYAIARRVGKIFSIFQAQGLEEEREEFVNFLKLLKEANNYPQKALSKNLYSTAPLSEEESSAFLKLGFSSYKVFLREDIL